MRKVSVTTENGGGSPHDVVWGIDNIGEVINRNRRQTHYLLENGHLPAKKIGDRWCSTRSALKAFFADLRATEAA